MKFSQIVDDLGQVISRCGDCEVTGISSDSRAVKEGDLFICYKGLNFDSHSVIDEAIRRGAAAVICEREIDCQIPHAVVENAREAMPKAARIFYGYPDKNLKLVAVTGTNGKTTTTHMLESIFSANGKKAAIIGTLGIKYCGKIISPELTTPDPIYLYSILADMTDCGVEYVFMEASAHALALGKLAGLHFEVGVFTNFTQDHLDFFGTMDNYAHAKLKLFCEGVCACAVANSDDELGRKILSTHKRGISYGLDNPADVFAIDVDLKVDGSAFILNLFDELYEIHLSLPAMHNVYNAMAAAACAKILGVKTSVIAEGLIKLKTVEGRLEHVARFNGADIFVDFAHTPDGLEKSLQSLKSLCKGKLYCLFGCGGNRDRTKRPIMGEIAAKYADFIILTSDNPRYEDPFDVICEIEEGLKDKGKPYVTVTERDVATEYALGLVGDGDILLVAGKGGEHYQEIMGIKHSYDDKLVIKSIIGS